MGRTLHQRRLQRADSWQQSSMKDVLQAGQEDRQLLGSAAEAYRPCHVPQDYQVLPIP